MIDTNFFDWYSVFFLAWTFWVGAISLPNIVWLKINTKKPAVRNGPKVSVLIPCRNEEDNIGRCLNTLLKQDYQDYEILVLDDNSEDATWEIISSYAEKHDRIHVFKGKDLPSNWNGYPHAMHQLAEKAQGDILIFSDADTQHAPTSISWGVTNLLYHKVDYCSGFTHQIFAGVSDALVVINMFLGTTLILPLWLVKPTKSPGFVMALGQYMCFKKDSYFKYGSFAAVRDKITCDVYMAREVKKRGGAMVFLDAKNQVKCAMYHSFKEAIVGISRNIYDFFERKAYPIYTMIPFIIIFMIAPMFIAAASLIRDEAHLPITFWFAFALSIFIWSMVLLDRKVPFYAIFLYPAQFIVLVYIALRSVRNHRTGKGHIWKGRKFL